jgi:two-component system nitrate/nitrite response regulator NarL
MSNTPIRIMLVDDHVLVRAGMRMLLETQPGILVVGEATDRAATMEVAQREQPDIILLDLDLRGELALDFLPELREHSQARVLVVTSVHDPEAHRAAIRLGAVGVVSKDEAAEVIVAAIEKVHAGEFWLDPAMVMSMLSEFSRGRGSKQIDPEAIKIATLTEREQQVIGLICEGLPNRQIGERLSISETTVRHHLTSIFDKLGLASRLELVIYAYRHRLADPGGKG